MFTTLVESRAVRRSARGAAISIALHSLLIATAVALTHPRFVDASPRHDPHGPVLYVPAPTPVRETRQASTTTSARQTTALTISPIHVSLPTLSSTTLPPIDFDGPPTPADHIVIGGVVPGPYGRGAPTNDYRPGGILDEGVVDRVPRIIGNAPAPRYPDMLRQSGATGEVIVRFVVDTLGRAEMGELVVVDATHPLFASAVKSALAFYRFSPGEASGRKVRTLVQVPFSFTLK